jgi:hypothetical protein
MSNAREMTGRRYLGILFLRVVFGLAVAAALAYAIDEGILRYRASTNRNAFATVTVRPFYAVERKDKKIEYMYDDPHDETCVNALFPHMGDSPCWYRRRHLDEEMPD